VVFDPVTIRDTATYEEPHTFPNGIAAVIVNGEIAWSDAGPTINCAGRALRRA